MTTTTTTTACYLCRQGPASRCRHCLFRYCDGCMKSRGHSCQEATEPAPHQER